MNHQSAWAEENRSPTKSSLPSEQTRPERRIVSSSAPASQKSGLMETEILIVASKLKQYVKDKHDLNTSANVMDVLSREVRRLADRAAQNAIAEGRKTLMDRDF
jgi:histone H3/H4